MSSFVNSFIKKAKTSSGESDNAYTRDRGTASSLSTNASAVVAADTLRRSPSFAKARMRFKMPLPGRIRKVRSKAKKPFSPTPAVSHKPRAARPSREDALGKSTEQFDTAGTNEEDHDCVPEEFDGLMEHAAVTGRRGCPAVHWSNAVLSSGIDVECPTPEPIADDVGLLRRFEEVLSCPNVDLDRLRALAWNGVPAVARPLVWQLLLGYLPSNTSRREAMLVRRRREYATCVPQYWDVDESQRTSAEEKVLRQILVDIPRTHPDIPLFHTYCVQKALERILYIWAIKHPASGYVQGMNDLVTPFYLVFLGAFVDNPRSCDASQLPDAVLSAIEADSYWCFTKLLDGIQDHYTPSQPGVQRMVHRLELLTKRIDARLYEHLQNEGIMFMQFAFRWMNCLLMRELTLRSVVRLWDTYLSEANHGFDIFHVYVCASFLNSMSSQIKSMAFQELIMFLQSPPTAAWTSQDIGMLLSQAFVYQSQYAASEAHFLQ